MPKKPRKKAKKRQRRTKRPANSFPLRFYSVTPRLQKRKEAKKMLDAFIDHMDGLFWEGYSENLAKENPFIFNAELNLFLDTYAN
jgi:hypothetical protein